MKIGIIGSGIVSQTLAEGFLLKGHDVMLGTRHPEKLTDWAARQHKNINIDSFSETANFGEVIILSVSSAAVYQAIDIAGKEFFSKKTVIDLINPIDFSKGFPPKLNSIQNASLTEAIQAYLPDSHLVKAFNTVSVHQMTKPVYQEGKASLPICGNHAESKSVVTKLAESFGWDVVDLGRLDMAFWMDSLAMMFIIYGAKNKVPVGFKFYRG
ncbi:MAG: NAD(P)-binding domain-containing protein [Chloroherpetonaceae bacterium]|nr:NAD(P)-binding domain-containing protein [Chloroherpetonaceae bacterium]